MSENWYTNEKKKTLKWEIIKNKFKTLENFSKRIIKVQGKYSTVGWYKKIVQIKKMYQRYKMPISKIKYKT